jgi:hypothetical protein
MNKLLLIYVFALLALICARDTFGQSGVARLEFPAELEKSPYQVITLDEKGLLLFFAQDQFIGEDDRSWHFTMYDTNLFTHWETNVPVPDGARYRGYHVMDSTLFLFFLNPEKVKRIDDNYQVSVLKLGSGVIDHFKGYLPDISEVKGFLVSNDKVYIAADLESEQAALFTLDLIRQSRNEFYTDMQDETYVEDLQVDPYTGMVLMVVSNYLSRKQNRLLLMQIDLNGNLINTYPVDVTLPSRYLNSARVMATAPSSYLLLGTYSNFASRIPTSTEYYGLESAGFFVTRFEEGEQQFINYINLLELSNLRPSMSARDYLKIARKKKKDEVEYSADYELLLRPLKRHKDQYILTAEAFYPDFRTVSDISYDYWGRPITHTYTVFEGYRMFQSILVSFDTEGNLLWDNSMELTNIKTLDLSPRSGFFLDDKMVILFFNDGNRIRLRAFSGNAVIEEALLTELATSYRGDKIVELGNNYMKRWYDDHFICYGYHTIRNNLLTEKESRTVFYINKVIFE